MAYQMYTAHLLQLLREKVQRPEVKNRQAKKKKKMKLSVNTREGKRERSSYEVISWP